MDSARQKIVDLLRQSIGLNVDTVSASTFKRAIQRRMKALHVDDIDVYVRNITSTAGELHNLIEELVIPETWFFRHRKPFKLLVEQIRQADNDVHHLPFRILSLPCSTGEEPYSIVMALLQAGIAPSSFHVMGVDISARALTIARCATYGKNSFRSEDLSFRDFFFHQAGTEYVLRDHVRSKVHFVQGNIIDSSFTGKIGRFDIIFCRNILIYLAADAQKKVINDLYNMLVPGGTLFTGHAEANLYLNSRFVRSPHAGSFAFHRKGKQTRPVIANYHNDSNSRSTFRWPRSPWTDRFMAEASAPATVIAGNSFEDVMQLANAGKLDKAADCCEQHLRDQGPSTRWYYLLGIIRDSQGHPEEAVRLLRKALYLDPEHGESLILLSLLAEQAGEHDKAMNYKRRAREILHKG